MGTHHVLTSMVEAFTVNVIIISYRWAFIHWPNFGLISLLSDAFTCDFESSLVRSSNVETVDFPSSNAYWCLAGGCSTIFTSLKYLCIYLQKSPINICGWDEGRLIGSIGHHLLCSLYITSSRIWKSNIIVAPKTQQSGIHSSELDRLVYIPSKSSFFHGFYDRIPLYLIVYVL